MASLKKSISIEKYYDRYKHYDTERTNDYHNSLRRLELNILKKYVKGNIVLDVGCGTGLVMKELLEDSKKIYGIDFSEGMLVKAKEKNLIVSKADGTNLPFNDNSFDVVYSVRVLPHIPNVIKVLREIKRVVKKDGLLILEFYSPYNLKFLTNSLRDFFFNRAYIKYHTLKEIKLILPKGLEIVDIFSIKSKYKIIVLRKKD